MGSVGNKTIYKVMDGKFRDICRMPQYYFMFTVINLLRMT